MLPSSRPRTCSFITRLIGGDSQTLYRPITSPYTSRILKPFIRRDYESRPLKLQLLQEIIARRHRWIFSDCFSCNFVWLENSYGLRSTGAQKVYNVGTATKQLKVQVTCFNPDNIAWGFNSVFYRLGAILSGNRLQFPQLITAISSLIIFHLWTPCVGNFSGQELTVSSKELRRFFSAVQLLMVNASVSVRIVEISVEISHSLISNPRQSLHSLTMK